MPLKTKAQLLAMGITPEAIEASRTDGKARFFTPKGRGLVAFDGRGGASVTTLAWRYEPKKYGPRWRVD